MASSRYMNNNIRLQAINNTIRMSLFWNKTFDVDEILSKNYYTESQKEKVEEYVQKLYDVFQPIEEEHTEQKGWAMKINKARGLVYATAPSAGIGTLVGMAFDSPGTGAIIGGLVGLGVELWKKPITEQIKNYCFRRDRNQYIHEVLDCPRNADEVLGSEN